MTRTARRDTSLEDFRGDELGSTELTRCQLRDAALTICDRATSPDDARHLLEMCGLTGYQRAEFANYAYGRVKQP